MLWMMSATLNTKYIKRAKQQPSLTCFRGCDHGRDHDGHGCDRDRDHGHVGRDCDFSQNGHDRKLCHRVNALPPYSFTVSLYFQCALDYGHDYDHDRDVHCNCYDREAGSRFAIIFEAELLLLYCPPPALYFYDYGFIQYYRPLPADGSATNTNYLSGIRYLRTLALHTLSYCYLYETIHHNPHPSARVNGSILSVGRSTLRCSQAILPLPLSTLPMAI